MTDVVELLREQRQHDLASEILMLRGRLSALEAIVMAERGTLSFPSKDERDDFRVRYTTEPPNE
jgi:hypothetical protein